MGRAGERDAAAWHPRTVGRAPEAWSGGRPLNLRYLAQARLVDYFPIPKSAMPLRTRATRRIVLTGIIYVVFLLLIGELPFRPGAAAIGLMVVWCAQVVWEIWSISRSHPTHRTEAE